MEMIVFLCKPWDCKMDVEMVSIAVKNTPIDKMDSNGAAVATDLESLKSKPKIGPERTDMPIAHGMEMIAANFKQEYITLSADALFALLSSSVLAIFIAAKEEVNVGVKEEAMGWTNADGKWAIVTANVL